MGTETLVVKLCGIVVFDDIDNSPNGDGNCTPLHEERIPCDEIDKSPNGDGNTMSSCVYARPVVMI